MASSDLTNNLRAELYKRLIPKIIEEDLDNPIQGPVNFWNDPNFTWNSGATWNELGMMPVIKNLFYVIETEETKRLEEIEGLLSLIDPDTCPEEFLDYMAGSFGHPLEDADVETKREIIKSIFELYTNKGTPVSWEVFYRMIGFKAIPYPLWKKDLNEADNNYRRTQYETEEVSEVIGSSGLTDYAGQLSNTPIKPGTIRIRSGTVVFRDNDDRYSSNYGDLISKDGGTGSINYANGKYNLAFPATTTDNVTAYYEHITSDFPYRAARIDLEVFFLLDEGGEFGFDSDKLQKILERLEMIRPIHVLVRLVFIVLDVPDEVEDFCTDNKICGPSKAMEERNFETNMILGDCAPGVEDSFVVTETGATTSITQVIDDPCVFELNPIDALKIEFTDGRPTEWW